jgi:hypothetical protein
MLRSLLGSAAALALLTACTSSETEPPGGPGGPGAGGGSSNSSSSAQTGSSSSGSGSGGGGAQGGGGSGGAPIALLLNEGFETSTEGELPDPTIWEPAISSNGVIDVTTARAHSGAKSMHVVSPSGSYESFVRTTAPFPVANNSFWGRLWFYIESTMPTDFVHWTVMEARGIETNNRIRYGGINNADSNGFYGHWFLFNVETQGMGEIALDDSSTPPVPAGEWICMEWQYAGQPGQNEARLFWNGEERPDVHAGPDFFQGNYTMPTFDRLYVGWAIYQNISMPYEVWIDDVAVAEERIFCQ